MSNEDITSGLTHPEILNHAATGMVKLTAKGEVVADASPRSSSLFRL